MGTWRGQYDGNPFVGLYAKCSEKLCLIPRGAPEKFIKGAQVLGVPLVPASVDGSPYVGLYLAMNSNGIVAPPFLSRAEKKELEATGLAVGVLRDSRFCAVGNNIACNDKGALVSPDLHHKDAELIKETLGVEVRYGAVAGYKTPGSCIAVSNKGWLAHNRISPQEAEMLSALFGCEGANGTVNMGTPFVGLGAIANSKGAIIGESSSGFEESRVTQALDLVD